MGDRHTGAKRVSAMVTHLASPVMANKPREGVGGYLGESGWAPWGARRAGEQQHPRCRGGARGRGNGCGFDSEMHLQGRRVSIQPGGARAMAQPVRAGADGMEGEPRGW